MVIEPGDAQTKHRDRLRQQNGNKRSAIDVISMLRCDGRGQYLGAT